MPWRRLTPRRNKMNITLVTITPLVALIAGILILVMPRLLNYIVAIYLIVIGVLGLAAHFK
jgi:threonine/homoserine efflux transporter RhtA